MFWFFELKNVDHRDDNLETSIFRYNEKTHVFERNGHTYNITFFRLSTIPPKTYRCFKTRLVILFTFRNKTYHQRHNHIGSADFSHTYTSYNFVIIIRVNSGFETRIQFSFTKLGSMSFNIYETYI